MVRDGEEPGGALERVGAARLQVEGGQAPVLKFAKEIPANDYFKLLSILQMQTFVLKIPANIDICMSLVDILVVVEIFFDELQIADFLMTIYKEFKNNEQYGSKINACLNHSQHRTQAENKIIALARTINSFDKELM